LEGNNKVRKNTKIEFKKKLVGEGWNWWGEKTQKKGNKGSTVRVQNGIKIPK